MDLYRYRKDLNNKKTILRTIFMDKKSSRGSLVDKTGLSFPSVMKFVAHLISDGVVKEIGFLESTGGRKASILTINRDYCYLIGVDIGAYSAKIGIVGLNGEIITKKIVESDTKYVPTTGMTVDELIDEIATLIKGFDREKIAAICIGISGMVDHDNGRIIFCPNEKGWNNVAIVDKLERKFDIPAFVDTSARCMALAERSFGVGKTAGNQIFVSISYSIAAGIIVDSELFRGSTGLAGELGHIQVNDNGNQCSCGNYDCLEYYVTLPLIVREIKKRLATFQGYSPLMIMAGDVANVDLDNIVKAIDEGDKIAHEVISYAGNLIGIALANMVNIINPRTVILGGGLFETFPLIVDEVERSVRKRSSSPIQNGLSIKKASLGWDGPIIGCCMLAINEFMQ